MSLEKYREKRRFDKTPEPTGGKSHKHQLLFVIQKHQASHLHYDFRLEIRGVLKSWAVPKGPSLGPKERRLAQLVEDHPFDYKDFEGIIPEGNYGAGTAIIWDEGTYEPATTTGDKEKDEKLLLKQFWSGAIKIKMHGKKLKGTFTLIKTPDRGNNAWLLSKLKDEYANDDIDITQRNQSVVSGLTIEEMQEDEGAAIWQSNRASNTNTKSKKTKRSKNGSESIVIEPPPAKNYNQIVEFIKRDFKNHKKSPMPSGIKPMEATLIDEPFSDEDFQYEIKWDGYRCIAYCDHDEVNLRSKNDLPYNKNYPVLVSTLRQWPVSAVLDGEVVVLNEEGKPDFNALQNYGRTQTGNLFYHVFDILWLDGINLMHEPLHRRQEILKQLIPDNSIVRFSGSVDEQGEEFFEVVKENGLEGILAKKKNSYYFPDTRSNDWLKLPVEEIKEYVIVGYTESEHGNPFSRIMFGNYHENGELYYVHHSGGGMSNDLMNRTYPSLKRLEVKKKPVVNDAEEETPIHWVKPELVGRFKQKSHERTKTGKIRHPVIFLGLREDIKPTDVIEGKEIKLGKLPEIKTPKKKSSKKKGKKSDKDFDQVEVWKHLHPEQEVRSTDRIDINNKQITIINKDQEYWMRITKWDVIMYYASISGYLLPFLKDRPLGLRIVSKWAGEESEPNFIRNMKGNYPSWVQVFTTDRRHEGPGRTGDIDWVLCNNQETLVYLLNLGAVDFHPWASRADLYTEPDYIVIDLDAKAENEKDRGASTRRFKDVVKVALTAKEYFDENELTSFIKTSGKSGMHILLPCKGISYDYTRIIAENICSEIHERIPKLSTVNSSTHARGGKVYIDASQNDFGDRLVAPYCVRAYKQPYVSAPLSWEEVTMKLDRHDFRIDTVKERVDRVGDLWDKFLDKKVQKANSKILRRFASVSLSK